MKKIKKWPFYVRKSLSWLLVMNICLIMVNNNIINIKIFGIPKQILKCLPHNIFIIFTILNKIKKISYKTRMRDFELILQEYPLQSGN